MKSTIFKKKDVSILIGNALDHFDTAMYSFLAPLLGPVFFPQATPVIQLIMVYSVLASSLITRPLGAYLFGSLARKWGPALGLSYSLMGVALMTVLMGCLPSYSQIGWLAPASLVFMRMIRGLCASGESTIAKLYILENKDQNHAFKVSYWYNTSTMAGLILASGLATLCFSPLAPLFSWRICFWTGGITGIMGYILRRYSEPYSGSGTALLTTPYEGYTASNLYVLQRNWREVLYIAAGSSFSQLTYLIPFVLLNSFIPLVSAVSLETMMALNTALLIFDLLLIPVLGRFLIRFSLESILLTASMALIISIIPLFCGLKEASLFYITGVRVWIVLLGVIFMTPLSLWYKRICCTIDNPGHNQYLVTGMGTALGTATIGRLSPAICLWLWHITQSLYGPALYLAFTLSAAPLSVIYLLKKERKRNQCLNLKSPSPVAA